MSHSADMILEAALRRIADGEMRVELQEALIERLMAAGRDAYAAQETLDVLRQSVWLFRENYRRLSAMRKSAGVLSADNTVKRYQSKTHSR